MAGDDYIQRILLQGDASSAIGALNTFRATLAGVSAEMKAVEAGTDKLGNAMAGLTRGAVGVVGVAHIGGERRFKDLDRPLALSFPY